MRIDGLRVEVTDDDLDAAQHAVLAAVASGASWGDVAILSEELTRLELAQAQQLARQLRHRPLASMHATAPDSERGEASVGPAPRPRRR